MALHLLAKSIVENFSGKEFTEEDLISYLVNDESLPKEDTTEKKKKKKPKEDKKEGKMTFRKYVSMTDKYKSRINEKTEEIKEEWRPQMEDLETKYIHLKNEYDNLTSDDENYEEVKENLTQQLKKNKKEQGKIRTDNYGFFKVMKLVISEMSEEEVKEIQDEVDKYNEELADK